MSNLEEVDPLTLIMELTDRVDELDFHIQVHKDEVNAGKLKLKEFEEKRKQIEKEKEDLKKRIFYIKKGMPEKKRNILNEFNSIIEQYQVHYENSAIFKNSIFFYYASDKYFEVKLDYEKYPQLPVIEASKELEESIGPINELDIIKNYKISNPPHVKDILDKISEKISRLTSIYGILESLKQEFVHETTDDEYKIKVIIWSMGEEFPILLDLSNFPDLPIITPSPNLLKYVIINELSSIKNWNRQNPDVIKIFKEISFRLDRKFRLEMELQNLKDAGFTVTYGHASQTIKLSVAATEKSPQAIFSIKIPPNYPTSPPDINLISSLNSSTLEEEIRNHINEAITYHEIHLTDLFTDIKELLISKSREVCSVCKKLNCPTCGKSLVGNIEGVSGEYECNTTCSSCGSLFHVCCWKNITRDMQKCSVCGSHIRIY